MPRPSVAGHDRQESLTPRHHSLRRTFACLQSDAGIETTSLSRLMGHSTTRSVERYVSNTFAHHKQAVAAVDSRLSQILLLAPAPASPHPQVLDTAGWRVVSYPVRRTSSVNGQQSACKRRFLFRRLLLACRAERQGVPLLRRDSSSPACCVRPAAGTRRRPSS